METLVINIPDNKSEQVKKYLKELGVTIERESKASRMARELNHSILPGKKPSMSEIVAETRSVRSQR
jgi:predicted transcriptional regulator